MSSRYLASGPIVWVATIGFTTLLLIASAKALWLVVPFLLAIILYYLFYPIVRRLMLAGLSRETAVGLVTGGFAVLAIAAMIPTLPWLAAQSVPGEESVNRYLDGGRMLIDRTLAALESQFAFLQRMKFHAEMVRKATEFGETFVQTELAATLLSAALWLPSLLLAPFFTFFFLRDGRRFLKMLGSAVPNAFFERTVYMVDLVHSTAREYFRGLLKLTAIDTVCLAFGLWVIGVPGAFVLGLVAAVLAWIPFLGSVIGCIIVVLVAATDLPGDPWIVYKAVTLFVVVRLLDDFVFMPLTVGPQLADASAADRSDDLHRRRRRRDSGAASCVAPGRRGERRRRHGGRDRERPAAARPSRLREGAASAANHDRPAVVTAPHAALAPLSASSEPGRRFSANARAPSRQSSLASARRNRSSNCARTSSTRSAAIASQISLDAASESGAFGNDRLRELDCGLHDVAVDDRACEPASLRVLRADDLAGVEEPLGHRDADHGDKQPRALRRIDETELRRRNPEACARIGQAEVRSKRDRAAAADAGTADRGNDRHRRARDRRVALHDRIPVGRSQRSVVAHFRECDDVVAGTEVSAGAGQDDRPSLRLRRRRGECIAEVEPCSAIKRVAARGTIDRNHDDPAGLLVHDDRRHQASRFSAAWKRFAYCCLRTFFWTLPSALRGISPTTRISLGTL